MAAEHVKFSYSAPAATTGIAKYRFVTWGANGVAYPAAGGLGVVGVTWTTFSSATTSTGRWGTVALAGLVKVTAPSSTLAAGDRCSASTLGQAVPLSAGYNELGTVVHGSSGGAGRVLSVQLTFMGTT